MAKKIMMAINTTWNLVNFRKNLIINMLENGYKVVAVAPPDAYVEPLLALNCEYLPINIDNKGTNIFRDLKLSYNFYKLVKKNRPDALITYTIKPNIYFSIVAHLFKIPVLNTVTGLGSAYLKENYVTYLINFLYRLAFLGSKKVFFQNQDDLNLFLARKILKPKKAERIAGSGIDLQKFKPVPKTRDDAHIFQFLFCGRIISDKGIHEFHKAAHILKQKGYVFRACILGFLDVENPGALSLEEMNNLVAAGIVEYLGPTDDIRPYFANADCIVLPSYREGISKTLLEAAAMAKPIITTDAIGCRDLVDDGLNGYLCKIKNPEDLAEKMETMLRKDFKQLDMMGEHGYKKIAQEYDERQVIQKYLSALSLMLT